MDGAPNFGFGGEEGLTIEERAAGGRRVMATTVQMKVRAEDLSQLPKGGGERIPNPGIMVIFGASGDLTKRKLLPALFHLEQAGLLPKEFAIVGVARRTLGDEFATDMRSGIVEFGG